MSEENNELIDEEELDLSTLSDDELVPQMHDDLYDGLKEEIMEQMKFIRRWGGKFVVPIPNFRIIQ